MNTLTSYAPFQIIGIWFLLSLLLCLAICWAGAKLARYSDRQHFREMKKKADLVAEIDARNCASPDARGQVRAFFR